MLAVVVVTVAALGLQITMFGVQVVRQGPTELIAIVWPHTATARYQDALYIGRQNLVTIAQVSVGLSSTTSQPFLGMPTDIRTHSGIYI